MTTPIIIQSRVDELLNGGFIASGGHSEESGNRCIQEWCSYMAGEPHGAMPSCVSPVLRDYTIRLNDRLPDAPRQLLAPYGPRMLGTAGDGMDDARREIARQALVTDLLPAWLRLAGMDAEAEALAATSPAELPGMLREICSTAWARRQAALELIRAAVREKLANRPAAAAVAVDVAAAVVADVAAAVAVVAAAAVAAAVAVVAAAAVAVDVDVVAAADVAAAAAAAAAVAVAVAAAAAVVAAAAVAVDVDVVAAADVAAAAAAAAAVDADVAADDPWGVNYDAAYWAARPIFEKAIAEGAAPRLQLIRDLAETQRTAALDVLERMIDPSVVAQ